MTQKTGVFGRLNKMMEAGDTFDFVVTKQSEVELRVTFIPKALPKQDGSKLVPLQVVASPEELDSEEGGICSALLLYAGGHVGIMAQARNAATKQQQVASKPAAKTSASPTLQKMQQGAQPTLNELAEQATLFGQEA